MNEHEYLIIVKGFDHKEKEMVLLIYRYDSFKCETKRIKKITLCKIKHEECVSLFYASHALVGFQLYYWVSEEVDDG